MFSWLFRLRIRQIRADDRRSLGEPVAFVDFLVEALFKMVAGSSGNFSAPVIMRRKLRELMRLGFAQCTFAKKWESPGGMLVYIALSERHTFPLQRIGIRDNSHAFDERIPEVTSIRMCGKTAATPGLRRSPVHPHFRNCETFPTTLRWLITTPFGFQWFRS